MQIIELSRAWKLLRAGGLVVWPTRTPDAARSGGGFPVAPAGIGSSLLDTTGCRQTGKPPTPFAGIPASECSILALIT